MAPRGRSHAHPCLWQSCDRLFQEAVDHCRDLGVGVTTQVDGVLGTHGNATTATLASRLADRRNLSAVERELLYCAVRACGLALAAPRALVRIDGGHQRIQLRH